MFDLLMQENNTEYGVIRGNDRLFYVKVGNGGNVYGKENKVYCDTDAELYGYKEIEINTIRNAFNLAKNQGARVENLAKYEHIKKVVNCAKVSLDTMQNVLVEG